MKAQLVLALCLVAIVACSVVAEEAELQAHGHTHVRKVEYNKNDYGDYKDDGPYPHKPLDCDNPKTWPSDWKTNLVCVDPTTGTEVDTCTLPLQNNVRICVPVGKKFCQFNYRTTVCRHKDGVCDKEEVCKGDSPSCPPDIFDNTSPCEYKPYKSYGGYSIPVSGPCVDGPPGKCDGKSRRCPGPKPKNNGQPCGEDGVYQEVFTEDGKLATLATVSEEHAKPHWAKCKRCYMGKCVHFKYSWWKDVKEPKHKNHGPTHSYYSYDDKPYKPYGDDPKDEYPDKEYSDDDYKKHGHKSHKGHKDYNHEEKEHEYEEEEEYAKIAVYPTKAAVADYDDGYEGYEPTLWCADN